MDSVLEFQNWGINHLKLVEEYKLAEAAKTEAAKIKTAKIKEDIKKSGKKQKKQNNNYSATGIPGFKKWSQEREEKRKKDFLESVSKY